MLNVNQLEKQWYRYKIKSFLPYLIIALALIIILISIMLFITFSSKNQVNTNNDAVNSIPKEKVIISEIESENHTPKVSPTTLSKHTANSISTSENKGSKQLKVLQTEPIKTKVVLAPSMDFIKKIGTNNIVPIEQEQYNKQAINSEDSEIIEEIEHKPIKEEKEVSNITIQRQSTHDDIQHVLKRFEKNNNPALSLFVAKKYYELGDYHKAYNYALMTNEINNNIEDSWIIFAKSLVKLGKKEKALQTLKRYISYSNSNQAKILEDEILRGKFK